MNAAKSNNRVHRVGGPPRGRTLAAPKSLMATVLGARFRRLPDHTGVIELIGGEFLRREAMGLKS